MLTVHHSNRLQYLAAELAQLTREPVSSIFSPDIVVVPSQGVARWLTLRMAEANGVCANVRFPLPAAFAWELMRSVLRETSGTLHFEPAVLIWRVLRLLKEEEGNRGYEPIRAYTQNDDLKRYQLALRLAEMFEKYLDYRPDWIHRWEEGRDNHWQAMLWRRLMAETPATHRVALQNDFLRRLNPAALAAARAPERLFFFGAPALSPSLIRLYAAFAEYIDVHLFLPNPCREYWGDIAPESVIARKALPAEAAYMESGNRLLASLGRRGRDFIDWIQQFEAGETEYFSDPGQDTLLHAIQSDILNLRQPGVMSMQVQAEDRSIQIHSCHGAVREVEILYDRLLALFEQHRDLSPSDVVVMTPDIERYAPWIEAVFAVGDLPIPYAISDRSVEQESSFAATLLKLLRLPGSRYEVDEVFAILEEETVQLHFGFTENDLETLHSWVREANIHWGIDAAHRASLGLPPTAEHSWRFGLDRLLLGYALPGGNERLFRGILPYDDIEASEAQLLGRFASFVEAVCELNTTLQGARSLRDWLSCISALTTQLFSFEEQHEPELDALRNAVGALDRAAALAAFTQPVSLEVARNALERELQLPGRGFLSGGVTFCAMVPMRSLPFDVVCLIGMDDEAFPRQQRPYGFDLMQGDARRGDPSRRDDDRYLFLESLLYAKRCLYLSYCGQDQRDNSVRPPSILVTELMDYIERGYRTPGGGNALTQILVRHPLQPFSRRYFDRQSGLFSYSRSFCAAAVQAGQSAATPPFFDADLPAPDETWRHVAVDQLIRFFAHPTKYFLRERLRVSLHQGEDLFDSREPFALDALDAYQLKQDLLDRRRDDEADGLILARAAGALPHGMAGEVMFEQHKRRVTRFQEKLIELSPTTLREPFVVDLALGEMRLTGLLNGLGEPGLLRHRLAKLKAKDRLHAWILHLAVNAMAPEGVRRMTRWIAEDAILTFESVVNPVPLLRQLLDCYWAGLQGPLHFFPETSLRYAQQRSITPQVRNAWAGAKFSDLVGEGDNPYCRLAFGDGDPLDDAFERLAVTVYDPLLEAVKEQSF